MRRIFIVLVLCLAASGLKAQEGDMIWAFYYQPATPTGDFKAYIEETSLRGWAFEGRRFMTEDVSLGGFIGYNGFYQEVPRGLYDQGTVTINAKTWRYMYTLPILVNAHYYIGDGMVKPFIGTGVGIFYTEQELQFGANRISENSWNFGVAPEAGFYIPFGLQSSLGLMASVKYNLVFYNYQDISQLSYINYNIGLGFTF
jgi:hypothetical protein